VTGWQVSFPGTSFGALEIVDGGALVEVLTPRNSPVLFGCRTGLCGTCLVRVVGGERGQPCSDELEILDIFAPGDPVARLCCQLRARGPLALQVPT
jgi:ferredoxin